MCFLVKKGLEQLLSDCFSVNVDGSSAARRHKQADSLAQKYFTQRNAGLRGGEHPIAHWKKRKKTQVEGQGVK